MKIDSLLRLLVDQKGSDLFLSVGIEPCLKVNGKLVALGSVRLDDEMVMEFIREVMLPAAFERYTQCHEANFAIQRPELGRFRVSCFQQMGCPGMVLRRIVTEIPTIEELFLPGVLREIGVAKRGLILFVGATGAGKSTTQAAMIGYRNRTTDGHILTIEDPVEFVHRHGRSLITQREVGTDTESFDAALKSALRQAPDVILLGEIRSQETMEFALSFAETGHLCMATLHANNANQAIERILHLVPIEKHRQLLYDLSFNLKAIVAQQLIPTRDGQGRRAAFEMLISTPLVKDILLKGEMHRLKEVMSKSREQGMVTFDQSLFDLYRQGVIGYNEALAYADSQNDVRLMIKLDGGVSPDAGMLNNVTID
jgi:twitching motility protein PilU